MPLRYPTARNGIQLEGADNRAGARGEGKFLFRATQRTDALRHAHTDRATSTPRCARPARAHAARIGIAQRSRAQSPRRTPRPQLRPSGHGGVLAHRKSYTDRCRIFRARLTLSLTPNPFSGRNATAPGMVAGRGLRMATARAIAPTGTPRSCTSPLERGRVWQPAFSPAREIPDRQLNARCWATQ